MKIVIFLIISLHYVYCQSWINNYNGTANGHDMAANLTIGRSGNIYVTGYSQEIHYPDTNFDFCTIKYNINGDIVWIRKYNGAANGDDFAREITIDSVDNIYVVGRSDGISTRKDILTIKYNSDGDLIWDARYIGPYDDWGSDIVADDLGNVYITGYTSLTNPYQSLTIKYNQNGIQQWVMIDSTQSWTVSIDIDSLNNVYVGGFRGGGRYVIIKYNSNGVRQWHAGSNITGYASVYKLKVTPGGDVYVTGEAGGYYVWDIYTVKYNAYGEEQWIKIYDGPGHGCDTGQSLMIDSDENIYVTGPSAVVPGMTAYYDFITIKYTDNGTEKWVRRYDGGYNSDDFPFDIEVDSEKNVYVGGYSWGGNSQQADDALIVKYDSLGNQIWVARYDDGPQDWLYDLGIDNQNNIIATGYSYRYSSNFDYLTIKYPPSGPGIEERPAVSKIIPNIKISPNPFQNRVRFDMPLSQYPYQIKIYRIDGRLVKAFNNITSQTVYWDGKNERNMKLSSGVYLIEFINKNIRQVRRLVLCSNDLPNFTKQNLK